MGKEFHINQVADLLADKDLTKDEIKNLLTDLWKDEIHSVWCRDDVIQQARLEYLYLSDREVQDVLHYLEYKHDATIGINWDVIDCAIEEVIGDRPPNENQLLPNGGKIIAERSVDDQMTAIVAYFSLSNHPYVSWLMRNDDRSCHWGHYHEVLVDAFDVFEGRYNANRKMNYDAIEIHCVKKELKDNGEVDFYEQCDLKDNPDLFSVYGHLPEGGIECISDHYNGNDAERYADWLGQKYSLEVHNHMI